MSISEKKKQVKRLQEKISESGDIDLTGEFDKLVDYLQNHGYKIVKKKYPQIDEDTIQRHTEKLSEADPSRTAKQIEESVKEMSKRAAVDPENMLHIWELQLSSAMERSKGSKSSKDFAELQEYIKAGHSIAKQLQNRNE